MANTIMGSGMGSGRSKKNESKKSMIGVSKAIPKISNTERYGNGIKKTPRPLLKPILTGPKRK